MDLEKLKIAKEELFDTLKKNGHWDRVAAIFLYGSQNYELDHEGSDFDFKVFIFPTLKEILRGTFISTGYDYKYGQYEYKDIRLLHKLYTTGNPAYLETLGSKDTTYFDDTLKDYLIKNKYELSQMSLDRFVRAMLGMMYEKKKSLRHPYPKIKDKIEKYGYDPKQLHHIFRLLEIFQRIYAGERYLDTLVSKDKGNLLRQKTEILYTPEEADAIADELLTKAKVIKEAMQDNPKFVKVNEKVSQEFLDTLDDIIIKRAISNLIF